MPKRQIFLSFHYDIDRYKAQEIINMNVLSGKSQMSYNDWETVKKKDKKAIKKWIDDQIKMRSCTVVLIGQSTSERYWINYEIEHTWQQGKGVVGIYINNLNDIHGNFSTLKGENPFADINIDGICLEKHVKTYHVNSKDSKTVYKDIKDHLPDLIEEALTIRNKFPKS